MLVALQAEKEVLLRSVREQEAEITNLRQATQLHQTALLQERDRSQRDMATLHNQMQAKVRKNQGIVGKMSPKSMHGSIPRKSAFNSIGLPSVLWHTVFKVL